MEEDLHLLTAIIYVLPTRHFLIVVCQTIRWWLQKYELLLRVLLRRVLIEQSFYSVNCFQFILFCLLFRWNTGWGLTNSTSFKYWSTRKKSFRNEFIAAHGKYFIFAHIISYIIRFPTEFFLIVVISKVILSFANTIKTTHTIQFCKYLLYC